MLQVELETAVRPTRSRADLVDSITHARVEVTRLAALAEDLLLLAQADGGQPIVRRQLTDVSELLDDTVRAYTDRTNTAPVVLRSSAPPGLIAELDPIAVRRILDNLLANSLRHTPAGGTIILHARTEAPTTGAAAAAQLVLRISDTGPGFPPNFLPHVFDRFTRIDQGRSRSATAAGSGLGLAIVETLAHAHGGSVTAANQPSGGAAIELRIPLPADDDHASAPTADRT